jgi:signal transduction histidine kinase
MNAQKLFGLKALIPSFFFFVLGLVLIALNYYKDIVWSYITLVYPNPSQYAVPGFSGLILLILVAAVWVRERRFEVSKYEFVNVVTHKFRTPLTYITWSIENLKKNQTEEEKHVSINQIESATSRLVEMTDILINMAKIEEGFAYVFKAESMRELVEHVIASFGPQITEKNIKFTIQVAKDLPLIAVDVKRIEFVIRVLLENAITYTGVGGSIDVGMYLYKNKFIRFIIRDSGIGMRRSDLAHLFTKFFRSKEATGKDTEGMGLGLYIAQTIIKRHGGTIKATSDGVMRGSTFTFDLPVSHEA